MNKALVLLIAFCIPVAIMSQPTITSFTPVYGAPGTLVTITGTNLSSPTAFTIGGTAALVISNTGTTLVGYVMPGAVTGIISVTTANGTGNSASIFTINPTRYPSGQQGNKLVGTGGVGTVQRQGQSVAISADGNTAIIGGGSDNSNIGAVWIFIKSGGVWTQQGPKLVGNGEIGAAYFGSQVALSADGNTAIVGVPNDNSYIGAAWIYSRSAGVWTQQGAKLIGTGAIGAAWQGNSVSLSADGNIAIVGGNQDHSGVGAVWVYTRSGNSWTQLGAKLVGTGATNPSSQGGPVCISADGNTFIEAGPNDNNNTGALWVFTRSGSIWTQQGNKFFGTGAVGSAYQGWYLSLSADGNTAIEGGIYDNSRVGAAWIFTRSGNVFSQQGSKLVGADAIGKSFQGSVSITADGNTAIVGGEADNLLQGGMWVYTRNGGTWTQQGSKLVGTDTVNASQQGFGISISADGNTALIGGPSDSLGLGATWVFETRNPHFWWSGSTSTNWTVGSNWSGGIVPGVNDDITIPYSTTFSPIVPSGITANCRSIFVLPNATVTVSSNAILNVTH